MRISALSLLPTDVGGYLTSLRRLFTPSTRLVTPLPVPDQPLSPTPSPHVTPRQSLERRNSAPSNISEPERPIVAAPPYHSKNRRAKVLKSFWKGGNVSWAKIAGERTVWDVGEAEVATQEAIHSLIGTEISFSHQLDYVQGVLLPSLHAARPPPAPTNILSFIFYKLHVIQEAHQLLLDRLVAHQAEQFPILKPDAVLSTLLDSLLLVQDGYRAFMGHFEEAKFALNDAMTLYPAFRTFLDHASRSPASGEQHLLALLPTPFIRLQAYRSHVLDIRQHVRDSESSSQAVELLMEITDDLLSTPHRPASERECLGDAWRARERSLAAPALWGVREERARQEPFVA